jgi:hypothetical protein
VYKASHLAVAKYAYFQPLSGRQTYCRPTLLDVEGSKNLYPYQKPLELVGLKELMPGSLGFPCALKESRCPATHFTSATMARPIKAALTCDDRLFY